MNFALFRRHAVKAAAGLFLLSGILFVNPGESLAASKGAEVQTRSSYMVTIAAPSVEVHLSANEHSRSVGQVKRGHHSGPHHGHPRHCGRGRCPEAGV